MGKDIPVSQTAEDLLALARITQVKNFVISFIFRDRAGAESAVLYLNALNRLVAPQGITLLYHNHETEE